MTTDRSAHEKRRQLQVMLDAGLVMLHLDPRGDDVAVPAHFKADPVLRLNLAWGFNLPALDIGPDGVYAVLSFNRQNFGCTLPWHAVFAMTAPDAGREGVVWPESVPPELAPYFQAAGATGGAVPVSLRAQERRPAAAERARVPEPARAELPPAPPDTTVPDAELDEALRDTPPATPRPIFIVHEGGRDSGAEGDDEAAAEGRRDDGPAGGSGAAKRPNLRLVKG